MSAKAIARFIPLCDFNLANQTNRHPVMFKMYGEQDVGSVVGRSPGVGRKVKLALMFLLRRVGVSVQRLNEHHAKPWLVTTPSGQFLPYENV